MWHHQLSRQDQIDGFQTSDLPGRPLVLGGSVKVNQRSDNQRFGLDVRVGRESRVTSLSKSRTTQIQMIQNERLRAPSTLFDYIFDDFFEPCEIL